MIMFTLLATFIYTLINLLISYATYFTQMAVLFSVTFMLKRLFKFSNSKQTADLIGLAGYSLTVAVFFSLLGAIAGDIKGTPIADPNDLKGVMDSLPKF